MRTKTLLLTAVLSAAGIATSLAQTTNVYSINTVGYVTKTIYPGFNLICNPLIQTDQSLAGLLSTVPHGTVAYTFDDAGGFHINTYDTDLGGWDPDPSFALRIGKGLFLYNAGGSSFPVTFAGEVFQGTGSQSFSNNIQTGYSYRSSPVPQGTNVATIGVIPQQGDQLTRFLNTGSVAVQIYGYDTDLGGWDPAPDPSVGPTIEVGEAFIYLPVGGGSKIVRSFTVPPTP